MVSAMTPVAGQRNARVMTSAESPPRKWWVQLEGGDWDRVEARNERHARTIASVLNSANAIAGAMEDHLVVARAKELLRRNPSPTGACADFVEAQSLLAQTPDRAAERPARFIERDAAALVVQIVLTEYGVPLGSSDVRLPRTDAEFLHLPPDGSFDVRAEFAQLRSELHALAQRMDSMARAAQRD